MSKFSTLQESLLNNKDIFVTMYGGMAYNPLLTDMVELEQKFTVLKQRPAGKAGNYTFTTGAGFFIKYWPITKKMKSKSKQSRYVWVVMKGEWK